jgi:Obg family GTPase CgtA
MIDFVTLRMKAGDGGNGRVSFRHEKYAAKGGPDGGDGGEGGNVIIRATRTLSTLRDLAGLKLIEAKKGGHGGRKKQFGERGADVVVEVPVGTVIWLRAENRASALRRRKHQFVTSAGEQAFLKRSDFENTFLNAKRKHLRCLRLPYSLIPLSPYSLAFVSYSSFSCVIIYTYIIAGNFLPNMVVYSIPCGLIL